MTAGGWAAWSEHAVTLAGVGADAVDAGASATEWARVAADLGAALAVAPSGGPSPAPAVDAARHVADAARHAAERAEEAAEHWARWADTARQMVDAAAEAGGLTEGRGTT